MDKFFRCRSGFVVAIDDICAMYQEDDGWHLQMKSDHCFSLTDEEHEEIDRKIRGLQ